MSLHMTKTRLALLATVADDQVSRDVLGEDHIIDGPKVTARIAELAGAGLVRLPAGQPSVEPGTGRMPRWTLTTAGRAALDAAGGDR